MDGGGPGDRSESSGPDRQTPDVVLETRVDRPVGSVWARLLGKHGLCAVGSLTETSTGDAFSVETAAGDLFDGTVTSHKPGRELRLVVENMNRSELHVTTAEAGEGGDQTELVFAFVLIGLHHDEVESLRARWQLQLRDLLGTPPR
jgi:hypothetical protein